MSIDLRDFLRDVIALSLKYDLHGLTVSLPGVSVATRFPDDVLDLVFAVGAQVFSEAVPVETRETAPEVVG